MDFQAIIRMALEEYFEGLHKAVEGLTPAERRFQPHPAANHIDFLVWHMARVEDNWVQAFARRVPRLWQRDGWYATLGIPEADSGFGYSAEQIAQFPPCAFADIMAYYAAVRRETLPYLDTVTAADLERCPYPEQRPGYTIGKMFSHLIVEESQHVGQVAYLRGLQRGLSQ